MPERQGGRAGLAREGFVTVSHTQSGLTGRALRGLSWNYLGTIGRIAATFISQIMLARLLGPERVGLFGYAMLTTNFLALVVEMGLQMALVQVPDLDDNAIAVACGRLLFVSTATALGVYVAADAIAGLVFATPQAAPLLRAMAPTLVVGAATAAVTAVLSRDIEFKVIQLAGLGSYVLGYLIVGVAAALLGMGVWSLVLAWHVQTVTACLVMYYYSPRSLKPGNPFRRLDVAHFGGVVMVTNMINWVIDNGPHVAIGRWLGAALLGQYTVANNLVKVPADHLVRNLQTVLFPLAARAQDNDAGLSRAYLTVLAGVGVVSFPLFTFVALMAEPIVLMLLGTHWVDAAAVLVPLSVAMIGHAIEALCGPILGGRGEPGAELRVKTATLIVMLLVLAFTASWSLSAVGWGVAGVYVFRWLWMNAIVMKRLQIPLHAIGAALLGPLLLAALCAVAVRLVDAAFVGLPQAASPAVLVIATSVVGVALIGAAVVGAPGVVLGRHLLALVDRLVKQRPGVARIPGFRRIAAFAARSSA